MNWFRGLSRSLQIVIVGVVVLLVGGGTVGVLVSVERSAPPGRQSPSSVAAANPTPLPTPLIVPSVAVSPEPTPNPTPAAVIESAPPTEVAPYLPPPTVQPTQRPTSNPTPSSHPTPTLPPSTPTPTLPPPPPTPTPMPTPMPTPTPQTFTVNIQNFSFPQLTVHVGDRVIWHNLDLATTHTATSDVGAFDTGNIASGQSSAAVLFQTAGSFPYHCNIHPNMTATVTVLAAGIAASVPSGSGAAIQAVRNDPGWAPNRAVARREARCCCCEDEGCC